MIAAPYATARADYHARAEAIRLRLVRSTDALRAALDAWREDTAPQRAVLVVEDEPSLAHLVASSLEHELEVESRVALTYDDAADLVAALPWACVVLDLDLGDPRGRTGVSLLRSIPRTTPVVISTGRLEEDQLARLAARARCGWAMKTTSEDLLAAVRAAIAAHGGDL